MRTYPLKTAETATTVVLHGVGKTALDDDCSYHEQQTPALTGACMFYSLFNLATALVIAQSDVPVLIHSQDFERAAVALICYFNNTNFFVIV